MSNPAIKKMNPIKGFKKWYQDAVLAKCLRPDAMILATTAPSGRVSARVVLYKGLLSKKNSTGVFFVTNYQSRKAKEIFKNKSGALVFLWLSPKFERQVRIEGEIIKTTKEQSDYYWKQRPRESQLSAWASDQSKPIFSRTVLDKKMEHLRKKFKNKTIPRPKHWGGYVLQIATIEFWQGRAPRLHDRMLYKKIPSGWKVQRLSP